MDRLPNDDLRSIVLQHLSYRDLAVLARVNQFHRQFCKSTLVCMDVDCLDRKQSYDRALREVSRMRGCGYQSRDVWPVVRFTQDNPAVVHPSGLDANTRFALCVAYLRFYRIQRFTLEIQPHISIDISWLRMLKHLKAVELHVRTAAPSDIRPSATLFVTADKQIAVSCFSRELAEEGSGPEHFHANIWRCAEKQP